MGSRKPCKMPVIGSGRAWRRAVLPALVLWAAAAVRAQNPEAVIRGTVRSRAGAPIAGAVVSVKHAGTGASYASNSNSEGVYELASLAPGTYQLQVAQAGFATHADEVELGAGMFLAKHFVLEEAASQPQQEATEGTRPRVETAAARSDSQISETQLAGLPLNGRSYSQLATLNAGVSDNSAGSASRGVPAGSLTVAGGRTASNNFLLDGTNIMDSENQVPRSAAGVQLGSDAVLQVQVFSANYGAEYGRGSGGVLNSITRSGTNEFHGTLFEYFRNSKLDARNFFDGAEVPPFKRNQFGATVSGPVAKDRTYFSGSFEAMRDRLHTTDVSFFPDAAARQGRGIATAPDGTPTIIPVDARVVPYLALYPVPNDIPIGRGIARNLAPQFLPTDENFFSVRLDQRITDRDSFFVRYTFDDASSRSAQDTYLFATSNNSRQQYLTLTGTHIFSPRTLMSFRAGYTRPTLESETLSFLDIPRELFFLPGAAQFGQIQVPGLNNMGPDVTIPKGNIMNSFQYAADVLAQRGPHSWKTGVELHWYRWDVFSDWNKGGAWSFNSLENFLKGGPVGTNVTIALPGSDNEHDYRQTLAGMYVQDEYKLSPQLAFSLGLRYEFASNFQDKLRKMVFLADPVHDTQVQVGQFFKGNPSLLNFSPRLGFTWSPGPGGNTLVAGGFGIYYDQIIGYVANQRKSSAPFHNILVNPNVKPNPADGTIPFPDPVASAGNVPAQIQIMDYLHMSPPRVLRYSFSLQQRLAGGWRAQATYVGARGNHLLRRYEANQFPAPEIRGDGTLFFPPNAGPINPALGALSIVSTDAQSFYNSLQLSANRNLGRGLSLQANYSFSKSVDDSSTGVNGNFGQYALMRTLDRGLSDFDIRHRLVINYFYTLPGNSSAGSGGASRLLQQILGGWRLGGIVSLRSGSHFSPSVNVRYPNHLFSPTRPNLRSGQSNNPTSGVTAGCTYVGGIAGPYSAAAPPASSVAPGRKLGTPELYFDPCVFEAPPPGTLGNAGRNTIHAASALSMDISLQKEFLLDARRRLQFRADLFNFPNHTNFSGVSGGSAIVFSGESGALNSRAGRISQTNTTSRQVQFALRFSF